MMGEQAFVGREEELGRLNAYLEAARSGQGQVCMIAGEPGSGKTALLREFGRLAQAKYDDLLVLAGECNPQTGAGEPFLPFREILALLTGDEDPRLAQGVVSQEGVGRVRKLLAASVLVLVDSAPDLLGLIPGFKLLTVGAKVGQAVAKQAGLESKIPAILQRHRRATPLPAPTISRENIFEQYSRFLVELAARQPLVVALEDLQWSDVSSVDLLFHLSRRIENSRILILGTFRPGDLAGASAHAERHPLDRVLAEVKRYRGDVTVDLDHIDTPVARRFVHALVDIEPNGLLSDFREVLFERTGGNPLFVLELMRDLRERGYIRRNAGGEWVAAPSLDWSRLPARVEGVIEGRVGRLEKPLLETLTTAGVEGEAFTAEVVARVMNVAEREVVRRLSEDLAKQHRLVGSSGMIRLPAARLSLYHFNHRLLRNYLYDRLDQAEQAYLHEDVARALEGLYADQADDVAVQLAWHYSMAGLDGKAAQYHRRTGELATARYANDEALTHFSRALILTSLKDVRSRFELLLARESIYERQGKRTEQEGDLAVLAELAEALKDARARAEVSLRRANHARLTADYAAAAAFAQAAVAQAEKASDALLEAQGYAMLGLALRHQGGYGEAGEWLELALSQAQRLGDARLVAQVTYWKGLNHYSADQLGAAQEDVLRAREAFQHLNDDMGEANCSLLLGSITVRSGDPAASINHLQQGLVACRRVGWRSREAIVLGDLANAYLEAGDYDSAQAYQAQSLAISREIGDREGEAVSLDSLGLVEQQLGRHEVAVEQCQQALAIAQEIGYRRGEGYVLTHLGFSHLELGDLPAARRCFEEAIAIRQGLGENVPTLVDDFSGLAMVELEDGHRDLAVRYATDALDRMCERGPEGVEYPARNYLFCYRVLRVAGEPEQRRTAAQALADGYALVQRRAARLTDGNLRRFFLEGVPFNRGLCEEYQRAASAGTH